jgi:chemotaxis protein MotA
MTMHIVIGLAGLAAVFYATLVTGQSHTFTSGLVHRPALILLGLAPPFIALVSYRAEELVDTLRCIAQALRRSPSRARAELFDDLTRFASEVRRGRPAEALAAAEQSTHALVQRIAPLVVKQYEASEIQDTASAASYVTGSTLKRSEEVLTTLARVAPAMGLVGTTLGLITLLRDLSDFSQLGPSMALALLCTLYGLVLANAVYQPFARLVHNHILVTAEEARLVTRALTLVAEGKPIADVRNLFSDAEGAASLRADPVVG